MTCARLRLLLLLLPLIGTSMREVAAQDCSVKASWFNKINASTLCIKNVSYADDSVLYWAADNWNYACYSGTSIPDIAVGCTGEAMVTVKYDPGVSDNEYGTCAVHEASSQASSTITLFQYGIDLQSGIVYPCAPDVLDDLTHELGHALGLRNALDPACRGHIMGPRGSGPRTIRADDCQAIDPLWNTWAEREQQWCEATCWSACDGSYCPPESASQPPAYTSPILIDLDDNGFDLSGADEAVSFDIDADGAPERISWTRPGTGDAFLVLDRNHNGQIDDGAELFGNSTPLLSGGRAPNGYVALAEYDRIDAGGNEDGIITPSDAVWDFLSVWIDANHDGVSQTEEITSLHAAGITALGTKYNRLNRSDAHGNIFRFKAKALVRSKHGRVHAAMTYDVFFVELR